MRILLLTHGFNGLAQRMFVELTDLGHELSVEFDISEAVTLEAVARFRPRVVLAPYLRRAIPEPVWRSVPCLVVHPGPPGDRGPSALDWAIQEGRERWGVTVLQAQAGWDAGPVWAHAAFDLRPGTKGSLYRFEVTEAAVAAVLEALHRLERGIPPAPVPEERVAERPLMRQADRVFAWEDGSAAILRKLRAADGWPGVRSSLFGQPCHLYDPRPDPGPPPGRPGEVVGRDGEALRVATGDGALWVGQAKRPGAIKLPAALAFPEPAAGVPGVATGPGSGSEPAYREEGAVGFLRFDAPGGGLHTALCRRVLQAYEGALRRPTRVLVLEGGSEFWCNGIHLHVIEAAPSAADESWANIQALDDLAEAILRTTSHLTVAALGGNAGAGGCFLARAADEVWVREGVILNPHYRNMGNLHGSEFWTCLLPPRVGEAGARAILRNRLPMGARESVRLGLYDAVLPGDRPGFRAEVARRAALLAADGFAGRLAAKERKRAEEEAARPLASWRAEELEAMHRNFYGFDPSFHVARGRFVHRQPHAWTPRHLARHRDLGWRVPED